MAIESNVDQVIARLQARKARLADMSVPLAQAGEAARAYFVSRFTDGTSGWAPNSPFTIAQKGSSRPGIDTGTMRNSITSTVEGDAAIVGFPGGQQSRIAQWFNNGTGVFAGHSEWTIRPRSKQALSFLGPGGQRYFARTVIMRGQPARPLLPVDQNVKDRVESVFRAWMAALDSP